MATAEIRGEKANWGTLDSGVPALQERLTAVELRLGSQLGLGYGPIFLSTIVTLFFARKTYGAGQKQVAQESWDHPENLDTSAAKDGSAVEYKAKAGKNAEIEITHSDGTTQKHKLVPPGTPPNLGANPPECNKVTVTYDKEGRPIAISFS